MNKTLLVAALATAYPFASAAWAQSSPAPSPGAAAAEASQAEAAPVKSLGMVVVQGSRLSTLPANIPTTTESVSAADIERLINATDSEDALKYLPSLLVRKRYVGDYNHAILSSRASGTGNSARSAVYADGILLSNFLGNGVGGLSFPPRWGLVTPEEIERVEVMYGPFSAAYPGNAVGAVVDFVTRMPRRFEAHVKTSYVLQPFELYNSDERHHARQSSASVGSRWGDWSWWINLNHTDSTGQPLTFPTRLKSAGVASGNAQAVTGAVADANNAGQPWSVLGAGTQYRTVQDHVKLKLAYELPGRVRLSYLVGAWRNDADGNAKSYLKDAQGNTVYSGPVSLGGLQYTGKQALSGADFPVTREDLLHVMQGFSALSQSGGAWDWALSLSQYDYRKDQKRQNAASNALPGALQGGAGTLAEGQGTGWTTLTLRGIWRPNAQHVLEFGAQQDRYRLRYQSSNISGNYLLDPAGTLASRVQGNTALRSLYAQDAWALAPRWKAVLGLRAEHWQASAGRTDFSATSAQDHPSRSLSALSPKAALSWQWRPETVLKASIGRALRMPTVSELYGATASTNSRYINDPQLKPEQSWTGELSAESHFGLWSTRLTAFAEDTRDALYAQTVFDAAANLNISRVQNVDHIATRGLEATLSSADWLLKGLDLAASLTYADSKIRRNAGFVTTPGDTVGRWQPNIPRWRATAVASYRFDAQWTATLAGRYSGRQYRTLNNADINGHTYMGVSPYATLDARLHYRFNRQWSAALGVDNLNNDKYWNFHPYPQRSYSAELKFDL
ncbi:TonB-dependent receptor [Roseateles sp. BYS180W]|uniref:TonB-dependent receptor n=1 Tax=Roseateles rivi TaxID=3299028 RepID=A0ABW7FXD1_9BURK